MRWLTRARHQNGMAKREILWEQVFFKGIWYTFLGALFLRYLWWCKSLMPW